jgi:dienelactone hydrolase
MKNENRTVTVRRATVAVAALACSAAGATAASPARPDSAKVRLTVAPSSALIDQSVRVRLTGLSRPKVTLEATARDRTGNRWRSRLILRASRKGVVDTRGSMRLFWSMQPLRHAAPLEAFIPSAGDTQVQITARVAGRTVAATVLHWRLEDGVTTTQTALAREGFVGTFFRAPASSPKPALLLLGGSEGGRPIFAPALLASHGYPTLSLSYFKDPGLPKTLKDIPLEYFAKALRWLAAQPGVDPARIVVDGVSRGGEAALLIGATYPNLEHGVIACTPSADVNGAFPGPGSAWTLERKPIPEGPIPVERIGGPVLATGGGRDAVWPSAIYVREIAQRARKYGRRDIVGAIYRNAGHAIGLALPNLPEVPKFNFSGTKFSWAGGTIAANQEARAAAWRLTLRFIAALPDA